DVLGARAGALAGLPREARLFERFGGLAQVDPVGRRAGGFEAAELAREIELLAQGVVGDAKDFPSEPAVIAEDAERATGERTTAGHQVSAPVVTRRIFWATFFGDRGVGVADSLGSTPGRHRETSPPPVSNQLRMPASTSRGVVEAIARRYVYTANCATRSAL